MNIEPKNGGLVQRVFLFNRVFCSFKNFKMFIFRCVSQVHQISPTKPTLKLHQISPPNFTKFKLKKSNKTNSGRFSDFPDPTSYPPRWPSEQHMPVWQVSRQIALPPRQAQQNHRLRDERFFGFSPEDTKICQILLEVDVNSSSWYIYHLSIYPSNHPTRTTSKLIL